MRETAVQQNKVESIDRCLQRILKISDMPFLGLYNKILDKNVRKSFKIKLSQSSDPLKQYLVYLNSWPAISLIYLTLHVCEGYGTRGTFEVYPFIEDALQTKKSLTAPQKEMLWREYRKTCLKLGLSISSRLSGVNYMVEEYLRQSGVPLPYVTELTKKMLRYAQLAGIPDDDDPTSIRRWQDGLCMRLLPPFSKIAQRSVLMDDTGFYVRQFIRFLENPADPEKALSDLEVMMSGAIHQQNLNIAEVLVKKGRSLSIPQIKWQDNQLGLELPPGDGLSWEITVSDKTTAYSGQKESRFVPFDVDLPPFVEVSDSSGFINNHKTMLWEDEKNNRLLLFSDMGTFVKASKLNFDGPLFIEPGKYQMVTRFIPDGMEDIIETVRSQPSLHVMTFLLGPGQKMVLSRGPAILNLQADAKPFLAWNGQSIKGLRGNEVYCSSDLKLKAVIPEEFFLDGTSYFIRLSHAMKDEPLVAPLDDHIHSGDWIDVGQLISNSWKPGVVRALVEICRKDFQRPILRSSIMVWIGLKKVESRTIFHCSSLPYNLLKDESDNLLVDVDKSILSYRNEDNRYFRMVFNIGDMKRFILTLAVPGIFLQLKDYSVSPESVQSLKKGATIPVSWNSRKVLEITSTSSGYLHLGTFSKQINFNNCGSKRLPLSGLVEHLGPGANTLIFFDETTSFMEDLLHLVAPHEILDYSISRKGNQYRIYFSLSQETAEVSLKATELVSGRIETLLLVCNRSYVRADSGINGLLTCGSDFNHELQIYLDSWPNGAWVIDLEAKINDRWGNFSNARGDIYSSGFILLKGLITNYADAILKDLQTVGLDTKLEILKRVNEKLLVCYALESWHELKWLQTLWQMLLDEFKGKNAYASELLLLSEEAAPERSSSSWIPLFSITMRYPSLYALPIQYYRDFHTSANSLLIKSLATMSDMKGGLLHLFSENVLNQIFAVGFANIHSMMCGSEPYLFSMKNYSEAIKANDLTERMRLLGDDDWIPGKGDYIGALHYLYAMGKLQQRYIDTMAENDLRRGKALFLCHSTKNCQISDLPNCLVNKPSHLGLISPQTQEELSVEQEHLIEIARFLSFFAKLCRWESRKKGNLDQFITNAIQVVGDERLFEMTLGYLLHIGKDIFSFYLMLWEAVLITDYSTGKKNEHARK